MKMDYLVLGIIGVAAILGYCVLRSDLADKADRDFVMQIVALNKQQQDRIEDLELRNNYQRDRLDTLYELMRNAGRIK